MASSTTLDSSRGLAAGCFRGHGARRDLRRHERRLLSEAPTTTTTSRWRQYARSLRALTELPGNPAVFVLCHPTKNATKDSLLPRGGGAFLAEVDANLTLWKDDAGVVTLHWAGKIRGPNFEPIRFELKPRELAGYKDAKGRPVYSVVAFHLADERVEEIEARALTDENTLLLAMLRKPGASIANLAMACGFTSGMGAPQKSRVARLLDKLSEQKLAEKTRTNVWQLTGKGKKEAAELP